MTDIVDTVLSTDESYAAAHAVRDLREAALLPGAERDSYFKTHPLNRRPVEIRTHAVEAAFMNVAEVVIYRQLGLCFMAPFRVGKSTAALMVSLNIRKAVEALAVHLAVAEKHDNVTERMFYGDLCESMSLATTGTAQDRSARVRSAIQVACLAAGGDQFLLIIDEGQNWTVKEWEWLRDTSNVLLNKDRITLTTAIFADPRIADIRSSFRQKRQDLWSRFMMKLVGFSGIRDEKDLGYFLEALDNADEYKFPIGSGISYTEFYLPQAFAAGWRLGAQVDEIWQAFARAASEVNRKVTEIGMQWVGDTIVDFLKNQSSHDSQWFSADKDIWDASVAASRYVETLV